MRLEGLTPVQWKHACDLAERLLETPPAEWDAALAQETNSDGHLKAIALSLANSSQQSGATVTASLAGWTPSWTTSPEQALQPGDRVGPYRIERELGSGGMGCVYLASRADDAFSKLVAIKVLHSAHPGFQAEGRIQAELEHENIVRLYDAGATDGGQPYLVMEFVDGLPVDEFCRRGRLNRGGCVRLFQRILDAVSHAHRQGVLHRDLKPSNILVNEAGVPKLLDFGIASSAGGAGHDAPWAFSPGFASPEQLAGQPASAASDVYSLGLVFRRILGPVQAELGAILSKAVSVRPGDRYESAAAFAADLERYRSGFPVLAYGAGWSYRASKFLGRHPISTGLLVALLVVAGAGLGGTLWQRERVQRQLRDTDRLVERILAEDSQLRGLPGVTEVRKRLLDGALAQLQAVAPEEALDQDLSRQLAEAYLRIGALQGLPGEQNLGDVPGAAKTLHRGRVLAESVVRRWPGEVRNQRLLAEGLAYEQAVAGFQGRHAECVDLGRRVQSLLPVVGRLDPVAWIAHHNLLIRCSAHAGRIEDAVEAARRWVAEEERVAASPDSLTTAQGRLARTLYEAGQRAEARVAFERSIHLLRQARRAAPSHQRDISLGGEILTAAAARPLSCRHPDDRSDLEEAHRMLLAAYRSDKENHTLVALYADSQRCLAMSLGANGRRRPALRLLEENRGFLRAIQPVSASLATRLFQSWYETAAILGESGELDGAARANEEARRKLTAGPKGPTAGWLLADAWAQLADIRLKQRRGAEAASALGQQSRLMDAYAKAYPGRTSLLAQARASRSAGLKLLAMTSHEAGLEALRKSLRLLEGVPSAPGDELAGVRADLARGEARP